MAMSPEEFAMALSPILVTSVVTVAAAVAAGGLSPTYLKFLRWVPLIAPIQPVLLVAINGGLPDPLSGLLPITLLGLGEGFLWGTAAFFVGLVVRKLRSKAPA